jgi:predicted PurR-regulated permease PerM
VPLLTPARPVSRFEQFSIGVIALAAAVALLYFGRTLCITLVISIILAFILEPAVVFFMRARLPRSVAAFLACTIALLVVYLLGLLLYSQLAGLTEDLPMYSRRINELVDTVSGRLEKIEQDAYRTLVPKRFQEQPPAQPIPETKSRRRRVTPEPTQPVIPEVRIHRERTPLIRTLYGYLSSYYEVLLMVSFVPFLVYFILSWSEHLRKVVLMNFEGADRAVLGKAWGGVADMARAYVVGNFQLGLLLSLVSGLFFASWHLPYSGIVGPVSGFLSLVPYIGLPLAIAPPMVAALPVYATLTPYLIIGGGVAFLHLVAMNLLYPKLVGARVHLNPLAVTIALMFWGTLWGGIGLVLAIPITAGIKSVLDNIEGLQGYGKLLGD